jgi:hypothetical protein
MHVPARATDKDDGKSDEKIGKKERWCYDFNRPQPRVRNRMQREHYNLPPARSMKLEERNKKPEERSMKLEELNRMLLDR